MQDRGLGRNLAQDAEMKNRRAPRLWVPFLLAAILLAIAAIAVFVLYLHFPHQFREAAPIISSITLLTTAFVGFMTALSASNRSAQAQRETAKVLEAYKNVVQKTWDEDYISARTKLIEANRSGRDLSAYATFDPLQYQEEREIREAINSIANDNEIIAISIERNIIDEEFYRDWYLSTYIADYIFLKPYIVAAREASKIDALYIKFEELALRWQAEQKLADLRSQTIAEMRRSLKPRRWFRR